MEPMEPTVHVAETVPTVADTLLTTDSTVTSLFTSSSQISFAAGSVYVSNSSVHSLSPASFSSLMYPDGISK